MASIVGGDKGKSILVKFLEKIKEFITEEMMEKSVEEVLVQKELKKRETAWVTCFENLQKLSSDLNRINRPDVKMALDPAGKDIKEYFSEVRQKEINTLNDKIGKHERALEAALKGDMKNVYELNQQSSSKDKGSGGGKSPEGTAEKTD